MQQKLHKALPKLSIVLPLVSMVIGFVVLVTFAVINSHIFAIMRLEQLAHSFPPNTMQAKRYHAMAQALKKGSTQYQFSMGRVPTLGGM